MGHAAGQGSDGLELLVLAKLGFHLPLLRHVSKHQDNTQSDPIFIHDRCA